MSVDVLDAVFEIDRKGGFTAASVDMMVPRGSDAHETGLDDDVILRDPVDGFVLWEGRIDDPGSVPREADAVTVECGGLICEEEDDEAYVCNFVDSDMSHWELDQSSRYADRYSVEMLDGGEDENEPILAMYVQHDVEVPAFSSARAYWYPFGADRGEAAHTVTFHVVRELINPSLVISLLSTQVGPGTTATEDWSEGTDGESDESVSVTADAAALIFKLIQQGDD